MKIRPTKFMGFYGVFMAPLAQGKPKANDVKLKDFI